MFDNVRRISGQLAAYGSADVAVLLVNLLLLPLYTRVLSTTEYGALAMLLVCEAFLKVVNRWGLDASFLRFYYEYHTEEERKTLSGTIAAFLTVVNGVLLIGLLAAAAPANRLLFGSLEFAAAYRLLLLNNFAGAFLLLPLGLLRIRERSRLFAMLTFLRSFGTVLFRLILVIGLRYAVTGIVLADVIVTVLLLAALANTTRAMTAWRFSWTMLRQVLTYGLPYVPHGLLSQTMGMADRFVLGIYMPLREVGLYLIGNTVAGVIKFYPVAFETAWMPFAYDSLRRGDAATLFARMGTYAFAVLVFLSVALAGLAPPAMEAVLPASYRPVAPLVPILVVAMAVQALTWFLVTSLNIAKQTRVYPILTAIGAAASLGANLLLIPPFGMRGAAMALLSSQALTTIVTAYFAQRAYRIPYEIARLSKVLGVSVITYFAMTMAAPASPWWTLGLRAGLLALFPVALYLVRFFQPHEMSQMYQLLVPIAVPAPAMDSPDVHVRR
jgi:O-antigen/teichoic acid export membrane protein